ncbi:unnamed protein product [Meloidogyne enterolobii]|uniref:Uncharacterized protein n=1 Tax=Meloidogyne enterolobii TaxID=390850 RepID=A0ACB0XPE3_MELEN
MTRERNQSLPNPALESLYNLTNLSQFHETHASLFSQNIPDLFFYPSFLDIPQNPGIFSCKPIDPLYQS